MQYGFSKGALIFTVAIGLAIMLGLLSVVPPVPAASPVVRPTQPPATPTPRPTPPSAAALHSKLVSRSTDPTIGIGTVATLTLTFSNAGTASWVRGGPSEARLGVKEEDRTFVNLGMAVDWPHPARPAVQREPSVAPGQTATMSFAVRGVQAGVFRLQLRPVVEGVAWMEDEGIVVVVTVR
jgi:hypothetical protein